ncbi:MAG: F-box protein, partial [Coxiellaceae bacterium]|nr:F-box protein [Coxiellaceae bacterium]
MNLPQTSELTIPTEIFDKILSYLPIHAQRRVALTCRFFRDGLNEQFRQRLMRELPEYYANHLASAAENMTHSYSRLYWQTKRDDARRKLLAQRQKDENTRWDDYLINALRGFIDSGFDPRAIEPEAAYHTLLDKVELALWAGFPVNDVIRLDEIRSDTIHMILAYKFRFTRGTHRIFSLLQLTLLLTTNLAIVDHRAGWFFIDLAKSPKAMLSAILQQLLDMQYDINAGIMYSALVRIQCTTVDQLISFLERKPLTDSKKFEIILSFCESRRSLIHDTFEQQRIAQLVNTLDIPDSRKLEQIIESD